MRLKRERLIRPLFLRDRTDVDSVAAGGIRILFRVIEPPETSDISPVQVGFAIGRNSGNAVVRNRVKRIMREVYRANQHGLVDLFSRSGKMLTLMVLFRGDPRTARRRIPGDLPEALRRLTERLSHLDGL